MNEGTLITFEITSEEVGGNKTVVVRTRGKRALVASEGPMTGLPVKGYKFSMEITTRAAYWARTREEQINPPKKVAYEY